MQNHEIEYSKIKARSPRTNGICEAFHKPVLNKFYRITFRKKLYQSMQDLQSDLDDWFDEYNNERTHQGKRCDGKKPMQTFLDELELVNQKNLDTNFTRQFDTCQV
jgi:hypothetical protein